MRKLLFILVGLISVSQAQTIQYIGAPTTTVISKGNFRSDSLFYLPKRTKLPTDSGAVRYQISDSSVYYWTGSQWRRLGVHIDTASMLNPYLRGSGTANYLPIFDATRSVVNSKVYQTGTNLLFNTTTASFTSTGISTIEANNTSASVFALKVLDTTRSYIASNSANTMDINNLRAGDIRFYTSATLRGRFQTDGTFRLNSLTGTGSRIVTADADGVLSATSSATGLVDTTVLSTRAWRQKGDDSLGAIIATKGSGTVTSVATGYGLSGGTITTTGTISADTLQLSTRAWRQKGLDSLAALEISGSGTTNYVPKFTDTRSIGNSLVYDDGEVKINRTTDAGDYMLQVAGGIHNTTGAVFAATSGNVGIGVTTTPSAKLDVQGNLTSDYVSLVRLRNGDAGTTNAAVAVEYWDRTTNINAATIGQRQNIAGNWAGEMLFRVQQNLGSPQTSTTSLTTMLRLDGGGQRLIFAPNGTESMRLNTGSELLLNTTTDAGDYKLQVSGNAYVTGAIVSTSNFLNESASPDFLAQLNTAAAQRIRMRMNGTNGEIQVTRASGTVPALIFSTEGGEKLRIENAGGIKFNPQSAAANATAGTVYYDSDDNKLKVYNGTTWVDLH